jgi:SAM-dependent methyltransferase
MELGCVASNDLSGKLRDYYEVNASWYDARQIQEEDEHQTALASFVGVALSHGCRSLLDVGCGSGRGLEAFRKALPQMELHGIEPVQAFRNLAVEKGFSPESILPGNASKLPFPDGSIDAVMLLGVLHHLEDPRPALLEAVRVAGKAVFISDHNIYGWGSPLTCLGKRVIRKTLGFGALKFLMTRGKGHHDTKHDGIFFPFSLLDHLELLSGSVRHPQLLVTKGRLGPSLNGASHLAFIGLK